MKLSVFACTARAKKRGAGEGDEEREEGGRDREEGVGGWKRGAYYSILRLSSTDAGGLLQAASPSVAKETKG